MAVAGLAVATATGIGWLFLRVWSHRVDKELKAEDLKPGSALRDKDGAPIGAISSVDAEGVIVDTGTTKIRVPAEAFGKDDAGLLLGISKAQFAELVAGAK